MTRGTRLSRDLREVLIFMCAKKNAAAVSRLTGIPSRTVRDIESKYDKTGRLTPSPIRDSRIRNTKMVGGEFDYLVQVLNETPTLYLSELQVMLKAAGVDVHESTVWRLLRGHGYSMKKPTKAAKERNFRLRTKYLMEIAKYKRRSLVFIDESSFDRRASIRTRAWAAVGERVINKIPFLRGRRFSVLPALTTEGMIHVNVVEGSFDMELFNDFIEQLLTKMNQWDPETHPPKSVIVLDNCKIHKDPDLERRVEERGMKIIFLPPYSPDFNPIEKSFSWMKSWFKKHHELVGRAWQAHEELDRAPDILLGLVDSVSAEHSKAWFHDCGYPEDDF